MNPSLAIVITVPDIGPFNVRGVLLTKGSDSSFAEAHRGFISEPIHTEDEGEDQEDEEEDERDCEGVQSGESKRGQTHKRMKHG